MKKKTVLGSISSMRNNKILLQTDNTIVKYVFNEFHVT